MAKTFFDIDGRCITDITDDPTADARFGPYVREGLTQVRAWSIGRDDFRLGVFRMGVRDLVSLFLRSEEAGGWLTVQLERLECPTCQSRFDSANPTLEPLVGSERRQEALELRWQLTDACCPRCDAVVKVRKSIWTGRSPE